MKRTNTFIVEDNSALWKLADNCARLWNELNFERRHAYINYRKFSWYPKHLYKKYAPIIGSATAQQIIKKNNEAWRTFLKLKRLEKLGKHPRCIKKVSMPGYWKKNGKREFRVIIRNDCYKLDSKYLYLPKGLRLQYKGKLKWNGKKGRLEIIYDDVDKVWRGFMTVKVEKPPKRGGNKPLYIDLGVRCLATIWHEDMKQPIAFGGGELLWDWWYWTKKIAREQSRVARINKTRTSRRIRKMFRTRKRRFRHAVNAMIKWIVEYTRRNGLSKIVVGKLKGIRNNNHRNAKANSMIHNFWSFSWVVQRLREKAEEYGIDVVEVSEYRTSSTCPRCGSNKVVRRGRMFKCLKCGLDAHRDVVGVINMGTLHNGGMPIGLVAQPLLLRWNGMRWEPRRAMKNQPMNTPEARISPLKRGECQLVGMKSYRKMRLKNGCPRYSKTQPEKNHQPH